MTKQAFLRSITPRTTVSLGMILTIVTVTILLGQQVSSFAGKVEKKIEVQCTAISEEVKEMDGQMKVLDQWRTDHEKMLERVLIDIRDDFCKEDERLMRIEDKLDRLTDKVGKINGD